MHGMSATVREAVFAQLRDFGLTTIFGNPGSTELPMFRDFPADFRYVLGLQESVVVAMADGFAQARATAAFVNLHSAIGVGHAVGSLFTAYRNQTPLVITAGQQARSILPFEPFLYSEQAPNLPRPYVKWSCEPARAEDVPAAVARAFLTAMQPPRGPTFVSVPVDDWDRLCTPPPRREVTITVAGDPSMLARAAVMLAAARRPVIVVGASVARDGAWQEVIALAERHQAAVWVSPLSSRNSFPEQHPLFAGFLPADREQIVALRPPDSIVVEEAPSSRGPMHDYLPMLEPDSFYTCASGGLGHGLPAAVGVALARSDRKVIALLGDGSAMYSIQGLWSAAELALPVAFVIVNNRSYRALDEFAPHFGLATPPGTLLPHLDFCALARAQGVEAARVSRCAELDGALRMAFAASHPVLIEVCVAD